MSKDFNTKDTKRDCVCQAYRLKSLGFGADSLWGKRIDHLRDEQDREDRSSPELCIAEYKLETAVYMMARTLSRTDGTLRWPDTADE